MKSKNSNMEPQNKIDALEEALRVIFLEGVKEKEQAGLEMKILLSSPVSIQMDEKKKDLLIQKLNEIATSLSLGQILQQAIQNIAMTEEAIAEKSKLPANVLSDLKNDAIYTNNVPIVLFKNLLSILNLSFRSVEKAIFKTFEILQSQSPLKSDGLSGFSPSFRKGYHASRESFSRYSPKTDGKELFENKEALKKYLSRLSELMND